MIKSLYKDKVFMRTLFTLAIPIILQNLISFSVSMADSVMLGFVGQDEMAAVTLANSAFFVINLLIFGFQSGESVMISQYWGKGDKKAISRILGVAWLCVLTVTLSFSTFAIFNPQAVMRLFTNEAHLIELGSRYVRAVAFAYPLNAFNSIYIAAHRSMENTKLGLYVFAGSAAINLLGNYMFIFGKFGCPALGVIGAAVGTVCARVAEFAIIITYIFANKLFRIDFSALFRPGINMAKDFIKYALPVICNETLWGLGFSTLTAIYGRLGSDVVAGLTICRNAENVFNVVAMALGNASTVIIGKQLGSGDKERVTDTAKKLLTVTVLASFISISLLLGLGKTVIGIFDFGEPTSTIAFSIMCVYAVRMIPQNITMTMVVGVLRGGGDTRFAAFLDVAPLWCISVFSAAMLALVFKVPYIYVFMPNFIEDCVKIIIGFKRFKSGKWINNITREA
ncbi:MAG: MATE family efflux transporter [Clostridia bacterium]|nr:MATE family efflux transporter [Clostridia bacterium]